MIVELFGPSGAGKTTLAYALATALEGNGRQVRLVVSSRPAERAPMESQKPLDEARRRARRLIAPLTRAGKLMSGVPSMLPGMRGDDTVTTLMDLLPPRNILWAIRYRRYLTYLCRSWTEARASDAVVLFDQAFLTALCSLALLARSADHMVLARALDRLPKPDLLVRLDAPRELLEARLRDRLCRQGAVERLFEFDVQTNLKQIDVAHAVTRMLEERDRPMTNVSSLDGRHLETAVETILRRTTGDWPT